MGLLDWLLERGPQRRVSVASLRHRADFIRLRAHESLDVTLNRWLEITDRRELRTYLTHHPQLLRRPIGHLILDRIQRATANPTEQQDLYLRRAVLAYARTAGGTPEAILAACINVYGGFVLTAPEWLVEAYEQDEILRQQSQQMQDAHARALLWEHAKERAQSEPLAPELVTEIDLRLSEAIYTGTVEDRLRDQEARIESLERRATGDIGGHYPYQWARIQHNLGIAYSSRTQGQRAENQERAIAAYQAALEVFTREDFPYEWAKDQNNLGIAYRDRIRGERAENQERAIAAYKAALEVQTRAALPLMWARTQINVGVVNWERVRGDKAENLERAIAATEAALEVFTRDAFPYEWAQTHQNIGLAYRDRIRGERAANLERALAATQTTLDIFTREAFPADWAQIHFNLGDVYRDRIRGEQAENQERAIAAYKAALEVFTREAFPYNWAQVQNNLGIAYRDRIRGERAENQERAIAAYQAALEVFTREAFPIQHRDTSLNLAGLAFLHMAGMAEQQSDPGLSARAWALAHSAFSNARAAQSDLTWIASTAEGKGLARGDTADAREMYARDAWCLWKLGRVHEAITALEEGRAQSLAEALAIEGADLEGVCPFHTREYTAVRVRLEEAIAGRNPILLPPIREQFYSIRNSIRAHCKKLFLPDTPVYTEIAEAAADRLITYLAATDHGCLILAVPPGGEPAVALGIPSLKWQMISSWLTRADADGIIAGGYLFALQHRAYELLIRWLTYHADEAEQSRRRTIPLGDLPNIIASPFDTLRGAIEDVVGAWRAEAEYLSGHHKYANRKQADTIRRRATSSLGSLLSQPVQSAQLQNELDWFLRQRELGAMLDMLSDQLIQPLRDFLAVQGWNGPEKGVALVPCGILSILPLNVARVRNADTGDQVPFQDTCTLTYQVSARSLAAARMRGTSQPLGGRFFVVADPKPTQQTSLVWAGIEGAVLARLARRAKRLAHRALIGNGATLRAVTDALATVGTKYPGAFVTIAAHGYADLENLNNCYMILAHEQRLVLAEIQRGHEFAGFREVNLEGCVTAVGDIKRAPDEMLTLAGGTLQAGAAAAVASQWSVSDRAACLFSIVRMRYLLGDPAMTPARSVQLSARWLRTATWDDIRDLVKSDPGQMGPLFTRELRSVPDEIRGLQKMQAIDETLRTPLVDQLAGLAVPTQRQLFAPRGSKHPFALPHYWGAFVVFGW